MFSTKTYPIGTHLNGVGLSGVWVLSKGFVPSSASDGVPIFEDSKIMDRGIGECLLKGIVNIDTRYCDDNCFMKLTAAVMPAIPPPLHFVRLDLQVWTLRGPCVTTYRIATVVFLQVPSSALD